MTTARKNLLATIKAATNRGIALGNINAVCCGLMAYTMVNRAPETVAVTPSQFAKMIGATTGKALGLKRAA